MAGTIAGHHSQRCAVPFLCAVLIAACVNAGIALLQTFGPSLADSLGLPSLPADGRAAGNIRQPNFLATQVIWAIVQDHGPV